MKIKVGKFQPCSAILTCSSSRWPIKSLMFHPNGRIFSFRNSTKYFHFKGSVIAKKVLSLSNSYSKKSNTRGNQRLLNAEFKTLTFHLETIAIFPKMFFGPLSSTMLGVSNVFILKFFKKKINENL